MINMISEVKTYWPKQGKVLPTLSSFSTTPHHSSSSSSKSTMKVSTGKGAYHPSVIGHCCCAPRTKSEELAPCLMSDLGRCQQQQQQQQQGGGNRFAKRRGGFKKALSRAMPPSLHELDQMLSRGIYRFKEAAGGSLLQK